ncbi:MAG: integrase domain-containing protein [Burkholderiales bacterium]
MTAQEILDRHPAGKTSPMRVLEILIGLFNHQHTAKQKEVSFKTRQERAQFLRRFFRDLRNASFKTVPDPRNLGGRHVTAMLAIWRQRRLAPSTIQTYLSFLRGFAQWIKKPGLIMRLEQYGFKPEEYERHEAADRDKSWSARGIEIDALISSIDEYDRYVGAAMRLMRALGLRKKEAIMLRPHKCVLPFEMTGLPPHKKKADQYLRIANGSKGGRERFIPLELPERIAAIEHAQALAAIPDSHMGRPSHSLKQAMRRFDSVMKKFGITKKQLGVTSHGLRHEMLIDRFERLTGELPPVRGGVKLPAEIDTAARQEVAELAGHARKRASGAYLGAVRMQRPDAMHIQSVSSAQPSLPRAPVVVDSEVDLVTRPGD